MTIPTRRGSNEVLKGSRFLLLKNYEKLDEEKQIRLQQLHEVNAPLLMVHTLKEQLIDFWKKETIEQAATFLDRWCNDAGQSSIAQLKTIANTLMHQSHGP